jgi:general secretion pathway protein D
LSVKSQVKVCRFAVVLALASLGFTAEKSAEQLSREASQAEINGDVVKAYLLYSEASAKKPDDQLMRLHAATLKPLAEARQRKLEEKPAEPAVALDPTLMGSISDQDLLDGRRLLPPAHIQAAAGTKTLDLRGDAKALFEQVAKAFHVQTVFDPAYQPKTGLRLQLVDADFEDAWRAVEAATDSFGVPVNSHRLLVASDTVQKRTEFDRTAVIVVPAPEPFSVQDLQEVATAVRGTLDIQHLVIDTNRRLVLVRDRVSKIRLAQKLIEDLMRPKPQVAVDVELLEIDESYTSNWGLSLPNSFSLVWFGAPNSTRVTTSVPSGYSGFALFGGGKSLLGLGITNAGLFATVTKGLTTTVLRSEVLTSQGQPASLHVGDKYPIVTSGYFGATTGSGTVYTPPPTINFEDLGLVLKITPYVHGMDEMTLEVEAEFKLLGTTSVDGIPVISNRKFQSKARLVNGEWAVLAGLMNGSEAKTMSGLAGLSVIPFFNNNSTTLSHTETLVVMKPHLLNVPPTETLTRSAWVGTETRPRTAL